MPTGGIGIIYQAPVGTPEETRQPRWYYRAAISLAADTVGSLTLSNIAVDTRLIINAINITCEKSCIQLFELSVAPEGEEFYRKYRYDVQGFFDYRGTYAVEEEKIKARIHNKTGETLEFYIELIGLQEQLI